MDNIYPKCRLCGNPPVGGLYDGIYLKGSFICGECEQIISHAEANAAEEYQILLAKIRTLRFFLA